MLLLCHPFPPSLAISSLLVLSEKLIIKLMLLLSYCFLSVGTVGAVRCVRTINSVKVFVEAYVSCNDAYTCAIPCADC